MKAYIKDSRCIKKMRIKLFIKNDFFPSLQWKREQRWPQITELLLFGAN